MNKDFEIYRAQEDQIPIEDKTRLDGFLEGRAEAVEIENNRRKHLQMLDSMKEKKI